MLLANQLPLAQRLGGLTRNTVGYASPYPPGLGLPVFLIPMGFGVPIPLSLWSGYIVLRLVGTRPKIFLVKEKQTHVTQWGWGASLANAPVISIALLIWASLL